MRSEEYNLRPCMRPSDGALNYEDIDVWLKMRIVSRLHGTCCVNSVNQVTGRVAAEAYTHFQDSHHYHGT